MDKQMIEEMTKLMANWAVQNGMLWHEGHAQALAEVLLEEYQPKIPEDAVVLTGMKTEQRFEDLMVAFDEMGFMPNTTHPFPEEYVETWKQRLIFVFGQLRKETAEKFARGFINDILPKIMNGHNEKALQIAMAMTNYCEEITEGKDDATSRSI